MINWQKSERKWNSLRMPVDRKRLPDGLMQRFLIYVESHQSYKTKWPSRQFCWKLTGSRHLCFGYVTWPRLCDASTNESEQFVVVKNKLMSVFNASVLLLTMNFAVTLSM